MRRHYLHLSLVALALFILLGFTVAAGAATVKVKSATRQAAASAGRSSAAPLNPEFLRWRAEFPPGTMQRSVVGLGLGGRPAPMDLSYAAGTSVSNAIGRYAASYDLRTLGKLTSVKDQGSYGTCWSFASLGSLESCLLPGETNDFSEDNLVLNSGFDLNYASTPAQLYNAGGNAFMATAYLARWGGPVNESADAYGDSVTPGGLTAGKHVQDVSFVPPRASASDNDNIKYLVTTYGGAAVLMSWQGATNSSSSYYNATTHAYYYSGSANVNHVVLIVGWNDNYSKTNFATQPADNGAFIVKNSWGAGWGESGYFYASYDDSRFSRSTPAAAFNGTQPTTNYSRIYQYDPLGWVDTFGGSSSTYWMANVFTAQSTGSLSAVGFYAVALNTSYQVWTGSSLSTLSLRTSGTLATMGYHTVTLPAPIGVTSGQPFVVAAKLTTPGYNYPLPYEYPESGYSDNATAQAGQSYYSSNGTSWRDLTLDIANANFCLKAYTTGDQAAPPDDDIPGVPLPASPVSGSLAYGSDNDDVFSIYLNAGDSIAANVTGPAGTDFDLHLFPPGQATVAGHSGWVARAFSTSYPDSFSYQATTSGTYYLDVDVYTGGGLGAYTMGYVITPAGLDTTPPTTQVVVVPSSGWSRTSVTATFSASDTQSSIASTEYNLDGLGYVPGTSVTVFTLGAHTLLYRSADTAGNLESANTVTVGVDRTGPTTTAYANVTAKKGGKAKFTFKVSDLTPTAHVKIKIYKGTTLKMTLDFGSLYTGVKYLGTWTKCTLARGTYTWKVYATDLAGNAQRVIGKKTLVVT